tara:strand:- start:533 stop:715 length:183 start_codon:yes stop_codon:yes gene_type:complete
MTLIINRTILPNSPNHEDWAVCLSIVVLATARAEGVADSMAFGRLVIPSTSAEMVSDIVK